MPRRHILAIAALLFVSMIAPAHAYIDPGSGSVLTSAIIGFFAAAAYMGRQYFYKIKNAILGRPSTDTHRSNTASK